MLLWNVGSEEKLNTSLPSHVYFSSMLSAFTLAYQGFTITGHHKASATSFVSARFFRSGSGLDYGYDSV